VRNYARGEGNGLYGQRQPPGRRPLQVAQPGGAKQGGCTGIRPAEVEVQNPQNCVLAGRVITKPEACVMAAASHYEQDQQSQAR
jgi:hypothetical protein